jgi:DNA-binding CsgD family transcriptional regulator
MGDLLTFRAFNLTTWSSTFLLCGVGAAIIALLYFRWSSPSRERRFYLAILICFCLAMFNNAGEEAFFRYETIYLRFTAYIGSFAAFPILLWSFGPRPSRFQRLGSWAALVALAGAYLGYVLRTAGAEVVYDFSVHSHRFREPAALLFPLFLVEFSCFLTAAFMFLAGRARAPEAGGNPSERPSDGAMAFFSALNALLTACRWWIVSAGSYPSGTAEALLCLGVLVSLVIPGYRVRPRGRLEALPFLAFAALPLLLVGAGSMAADRLSREASRSYALWAKASLPDGLRRALPAGASWMALIGEEAGGEARRQVVAARTERDRAFAAGAIRWIEAPYPREPEMVFRAGDILDLESFFVVVKQADAGSSRLETAFLYRSYLSYTHRYLVVLVSIIGAVLLLAVPLFFLLAAAPLRAAEGSPQLRAAPPPSAPPLAPSSAPDLAGGPVLPASADSAESLALEEGAEAAALTPLEAFAVEHRLTPREREVLLDLIDGLSYGEIAERRDIAAITVKVHTKHIYKKTGVGSRAKLVRMVLEKGYKLPTTFG